MERQLFQVKNTFLDLDDELELHVHRRQQSEPASRCIESQAEALPVVAVSAVSMIQEPGYSPEKDGMAAMPRVLTGEYLDTPRSQTNEGHSGYLPVYQSDWCSNIPNWGVTSNYIVPDSNTSKMVWYGYGHNYQNPIPAALPEKMLNLSGLPGYQSYQDFSGEAPAGEVLEAGKDFPRNFASANASFTGNLGAQPGYQFPKSAPGTWSAWSEQPPRASPASPTLSPECDVPSEWQSVSTVMARNLPNKYNQQMLLDELNAAGFAGAYDFLYLPIDPETCANRGYAFINFVSSSYAWMMRTTYEGQKMGKFNSDKVVSVVPAALQGFEANYAHYSTARVMRGLPQTRPLFLREWLPGQKVKTERRRGGRRTQGSLIDLAVRQQGEDPGHGHGDHGQHGQHGQRVPSGQIGHIGLTGQTYLRCAFARAVVARRKQSIDSVNSVAFPCAMKFGALELWELPA